MLERRPSVVSRERKLLFVSSAENDSGIRKTLKLCQIPDTECTNFAWSLRHIPVSGDIKYMSESKWK